jgi:hypothetical protein
MRRRLSYSLVVVLIGAAGLALPTSPAWSVAGFGDVGEGQFYTKAVQWMVDNDLTTGTSPTCFSPDDPATRGQAAVFMWRMEGKPAAPPHPFTDVTKDWQQKAISWLFANKITTGTSPTTYDPERALRRGELAVLLYRLAGEPDGAPPHPFTDVVKDWQQKAISWLFANKITTGTSPTEFSPDDPATRGQLATFLYRYKGEPKVTIDPTSPICDQ